MAELSVGEACVLGAVQGITEFLPISSDGHLALAQHFMTPMPGAEGLAVTVALHIGTLAAVMIYFRRELGEMLAGVLGRPAPAYARKWAILIILGTLPAAVVGLPLKPYIERTYDSLWVIGASFIATGVFLFAAAIVSGATRTEEELSVDDAVFIGCCQVLALLPGVSRSGTTISSAMLRHVRADVAAKFSFLLAVPAIAGAITAEGKAMLGLSPDLRVPLAVGIVTALVTGLGAIAFLLRLVRNAKLHYFAYYCWVLGGAVIVGAMLQAS
jgi:undecaprenyl-diphosphatase